MPFFPPFFFFPFVSVVHSLQAMPVSSQNVIQAHKVVHYQLGGGADHLITFWHFHGLFFIQVQ